MEYAAHFTEDGRLQTVKEHLISVAEKGKRDSELINMPSLYYLAAILHDMGKNTARSDEYQRTVGSGGEWNKGKVIHSNCGGRYIYEKFIKNNDSDKTNNYTVEIISSVIMSHHGLFDFDYPKSGKENGFVTKINNTNYDYNECKKLTLDEVISEKEIEELYLNAKNEVNEFLNFCSKDEDKRKDGESIERIKLFNCSLLIRVLLSILVDSDHSDTAEFVNQIERPKLYGDAELWEKCCNYFEEKIKLFNKDTELNKIRAEISDKALAYSENSENIVRMTVPTGGGKTISSLRYAIHHAKKFNKNRIFYVAPFNSILEQNYNEIKSFLPDDVSVLPHFGDMLYCNYNESLATEQNIKYMSENWNSYVIATSMVQFLNSLFDGKISSIRRMRGLINSVIIIDEVQSIPYEFIRLFNMAMKFLAYICNCTIVLCTATQPPFEHMDYCLRLDESYEMINGFEDYSEKMRRTRIIDKTISGGYTADNVADFLHSLSEDCRTILCVVNTKKAAFEVFKSAKHLFEDEKIVLVHLSTNMCPEHRANVIKNMKDEMKNGKRVLCVSTQLIEAGVDISFETVVRSLAGTDSIVQAAGRCNRNAERDIGYVYILNISNEYENVSSLKSIQKGKSATIGLLKRIKKKPDEYEDLLDLKAIKKFYIDYYKNFDKKDLYVEDFTCSIFEMLSTNEKGSYHTKTLLRAAMKTAGECFEVITDINESVLVPYKDGKELISELLSEGYKDYDAIIKKAQRYLIGLPKNKLKDSYISVDKKTGIRFLADGYYDEIYGFSENPNLDFCYF